MYLSFRVPFLPLTPPRSPAKPTVPSLPPSARWHHRAPPPRSPSTGSPGWTWSRRRLLQPGKRQWCARFKYTRINLRKRRRKKRMSPRCRGAPLSRTLRKWGPMRKAPLRRGRRRRSFQVLKKKVRLYFTPLIDCGFVNFKTDCPIFKHMDILMSVGSVIEQTFIVSKGGSILDICCIISRKCVCREHFLFITTLVNICVQRKKIC